MKVLDIAFKDMIQSFRSLFAVAFMFLVPILLTGMFYLMFGGNQNGETESGVPHTQVVVANLDTGTFVVDPATGALGSLGNVLIQVLSAEEFGHLITLTVVSDQDAGPALFRAHDAALLPGRGTPRPGDDVVLFRPDRDPVHFPADRGQGLGRQGL